MKRIVWKLMIIITILFVFQGCFDYSSSKTIYVGEDEEFENIQNAIDNASDGDTILVKSGVYFETLIIDKSINLIGENKNTTIIQYPENIDLSDYIILINKEKCKINELKIIGPGTYSDVIGIEVNSSNNNISHLIVNNNYIGINFYDGTKNNIALSNIVTKNLYGISLHQSHLNNISKNNITSSIFYGIYIFLAEENKIFENQLSLNRYGLKVKGSEQNIIFKNKIFNNYEGIEICCGSSYNIIYSNAFINNNNHANDTLFNQWDYEESGNYWDDYKGLDSDDNGIGDIPYNISGNQNIDRFPLMSYNFL
jgi:parallel beta-helix repeat protein